MSFFWWILTIGVLIIWIASVADIIKRRKILSTTAVITWLLVVIIPLLCMGLISQEWATGTIETLMTAPVGAAPVTYMVNGKQYVSVAVGWVA